MLKRKNKGTPWDASCPRWALWRWQCLSPSHTTTTSSQKLCWLEEGFSIKHYNIYMYSCDGIYKKKKERKTMETHLLIKAVGSQVILLRQWVPSTDPIAHGSHTKPERLKDSTKHNDMQIICHWILWPYFVISGLQGAELLMKRLHSAIKKICTYIGCDASLTPGLHVTTWNICNEQRSHRWV